MRQPELQHTPGIPPGCTSTPHTMNELNPHELVGICGGNPVLPLVYTLVGAVTATTLNNIYANWAAFKTGVSDGFENALK